MFINRVRELAFLEKRYAAPQAELVVLYGRRRLPFHPAALVG